MGVFTAIANIVPLITDIFKSRAQTKINAEAQKQQIIANSTDHRQINNVARGDGRTFQIIALILFFMPWWSVLLGPTFSNYVRNQINILQHQMPIQADVLETILLGRGLNVRSQDVIDAVKSVVLGIFKRK